MTISNIKNIIFDLGDVLLDLDFNRVNAKFEKLLGADFSLLSTSEETRDLFIKFETGHYSEESFINGLQRQATLVPDGRAMIDGWNSLLVGVPPQRIKMLRDLKEKGYRLYLLSNTNSLHIHWLNRYLKREHDVENFSTQFFDKTYYSHLVKMRKPNLEIYEYVLNDAFINAEETLFIDDNEANILAAQDAGIATIHHNSGRDIVEVLREAGFLL